MKIIKDPQIKMINNHLNQMMKTNMMMKRNNTMTKKNTMTMKNTMKKKKNTMIIRKIRIVQVKIMLMKVQMIKVEVNKIQVMTNHHHKMLILMKVRKMDIQIKLIIHHQKK